MSVVARLEMARLDPPLELRALTEQARGDGAIVSFVGLARPQAKSVGIVETLVLEHHDTLTRQSLEEIAVACAQKFDVSQVRVVHRWGTIPAGEPVGLGDAASL